MTIRRDDLAAAAAVGLLQYRQVDPLLVFLLQREVRAKRQALQEQADARENAGLHALLSYVVTLMAIATAGLFAVLFITRAMRGMGNDAFIFFTGLYLLAGLGVAAWLRRRGMCARVRMLAAIVMASLPLAVLALQQVGG
jgi:polyferredoxin